MGLSSAKKHIQLVIADELQTLVDLANESNQRSLVASQAQEDGQLQRARIVLRELRLGLTFDSEVTRSDEDDEPDHELDALAKAHEAEPKSIPLMAQALGDYARLGATREKQLQDLPDFDISTGGRRQATRHSFAPARL